MQILLIGEDTDGFERPLICSPRFPEYTFARAQVMYTQESEGSITDDVLCTSPVAIT